jgi:hypothetical protein
MTISAKLQYLMSVSEKITDIIMGKVTAVYNSDEFSKRLWW